MLNEKTHDIGGLKINYAEAGSGAPLMMLHGISQRWQYWSQEVGLLSHRFHVSQVAWSHQEDSGHRKPDFSPILNRR